VARDISERARADEERTTLQQQLLRSQRMESVGRLAGGIAHDFNNLLTVINANADLVSSDLPPGSPIAADVLQIRTAGARAAALTRQLLAFSRQSVMRREVLDLNALLTGFLGMLKRVIGEDIKVDAKLTSQECRVNADPGQLEQVLMNLCVNARDAMPRGGTLTLETQRMQVDAEYAARHETMRPGPHVLVTVSDTGEGMSREVQTHMFEPFFTTKEAGKGTGLGLSTSQAIVRSHGGRIEAFSEPPDGARFEIHLPVAPVTAQPASSGELTATPKGNGETILVVDDEPSVRLVMRTALERSGYRVLPAANGKEAIEVFRAEPQGSIAAVIIDMMMPVMGGLAAMQEMVKIDPAVRIIAASGIPDNETTAKAVGTQVRQFLAKPFSTEKLLRAVGRALST
jgi:two-component system cell cycle sensor histidine kinase/response regulator CckA